MEDFVFGDMLAFVSYTYAHTLTLRYWIDSDSATAYLILIVFSHLILFAVRSYGAHHTAYTLRANFNVLCVIAIPITFAWFDGVHAYKSHREYVWYATVTAPSLRTLALLLFLI